MKVFLTGGTGFIGGHVAGKLRERGDEVLALVRNPAKAGPLRDAGCELVEGSLADETAIASALEGCDAAIHGAAIYEVGIPEGRRSAMHEANVAGTERVLGAALAAGTPRVVYISTIAAFGNTHGDVVDESYQHPAREFTSHYERTKHEAHLVALRLIEEGLPCVIVQPGGVYGPGDHSELGNLSKQVLAGRLPLIPFPDFGMTVVHVDDVAGGVLLALDKGAMGESYVLGGEVTTNREMIRTVAEVGGRKPPSRALPTSLMRAIAPAGRLVGPLMGYPPNMRELISSADGVTFWASSDKAKRDLGYSPRDLRTTVADTLRELEKLPA